MEKKTDKKTIQTKNRKITISLGTFDKELDAFITPMRAANPTQEYLNIDPAGSFIISESIIK